MGAVRRTKLAVGNPDNAWVSGGVRGLCSSVLARLRMITFFARLLAETDRSVYAQVHTAVHRGQSFSSANVAQSQSGAAVSGCLDVAVLAAEARLAKKDPGELATFRSLRLNMRAG